MAVGGLDSIIGQSLGGLSAQTSNTADSTRVSLSSANGSLKLVENKFDRVELSSGRPRPLDATIMQKAETIASTLAEKGKINRRDTAEVREDRVVAALVGMRLIQNFSELATPVWVGGIPAPTPIELKEAYKRLTQLPSEISSVDDKAGVLNMRSELLDHFRDADFSSSASEYFNTAA